MLADIDNFMLGNPLFIKKSKNEYSDPIFEGSEKFGKNALNLRKTN